MTSPRPRFPLLVALLAAMGLAVGACASDPVVVSDPVVAPAESGSTAGQAANSGGDAGTPSSGADETGDAEELPTELPEDFEFNFGTDDDEDEGDSAAQGSTGDAGQGDGATAGGFDVASLRAVADTTQSSSSYRFDLRFDWVMGDFTFDLSISPDTPLMTGVVAGQASSMSADFGPMFEELFASFGDGGDVAALFGGDLTMQAVDDGEGRLYLTSPMFGVLAGDPSLPSELAALGDGWGVIDLNRVEGLTVGDVASLTGAQAGSSPEAMLDLLRSAGTVEELGRADVRGVPTDHLRVGVDFGALAEAQGTDLAELEEFAGDLGGLTDVVLPFDVFVDDDGRVRRVTLTIDLDAIESIAGESFPGGTTFSMTTIMDFYDYDDPSITVDVPGDDEIVVDLTDGLADFFG